MRVDIDVRNVFVFPTHNLYSWDGKTVTHPELDGHSCRDAAVVHQAVAIMIEDTDSPTNICDHKEPFTRRFLK